LHTHRHTRAHTHALIDCADERGCRRRGTFTGAKGSNVERRRCKQQGGRGGEGESGEERGWKGKIVSAGRRLIYGV